MEAALDQLADSLQDSGWQGYYSWDTIVPSWWAFWRDEREIVVSHCGLECARFMGTNQRVHLALFLAAVTE